MTSLLNYRTGVIILHSYFSVFSLATYIRQSSVSGQCLHLHSLSDIFFLINVWYATTKHIIKCLCTRKYFTLLKTYTSNLFRHEFICFNKQVCAPGFLSIIPKAFISLTFFFFSYFEAKLLAFFEFPFFVCLFVCLFMPSISCGENNLEIWR